MDNEIRVSPIRGENALRVRCFNINIVHLTSSVCFDVYYKGDVLRSFEDLSAAVEFCRE